MSAPKNLTLTREAWNEISAHAAEIFPEECCGMVLHKDGQDRVRRCANIQNRLHALDPETYPRDATIAYAMDLKELELVVGEAESTGAKIKAFYHSHPAHEAYFSSEDKAFATPFGEPTFPDAVQIVVSIYDKVVKKIRAYAWSREKQDFIEIAAKKL